MDGNRFIEMLAESFAGIETSYHKLVSVCITWITIKNSRSEIRVEIDYFKITMLVRILS